MNAEKCTQLNMSNYYPKHTSKKYWLSLFNPPTSGGTALLPPLCPNRLFSEVLGWNPGLECGRECSTTGPRPTPLIKFLVVPQAPFPITLWGLLCNFATQPFLGRDTLHYKAELTWGHRPYGPQSLSVLLSDPLQERQSRLQTVHFAFHFMQFRNRLLPTTP